MTNKLNYYVFIILFLFAAGCSAEKTDNNYDEEGLKVRLLEILPEEIDLISIEKTDMKGFFEVNFDGIEPLYVSADGNLSLIHI